MSRPDSMFPMFAFRIVNVAFPDNALSFYNWPCADPEGGGGRGSAPPPPPGKLQKYRVP